MTAYYNEIDAYCASWLRNLIRDGRIAPGDVDERSITEVSPYDIKAYTQCHFFAGIAGWPLALRLAGWDDGKPVWTGSCPCQPFSAAGRRKGKADLRHLWPAWFRLIRERRPPVLFGEQVAAAIAFGWVDEVFNDLEACEYACAAAVLPACGVGAPHRRDRLYFVAESACERRNGRGPGPQCEGRPESPDDCDGVRIVEHALCVGRREGRAQPALWSGRTALIGAGMAPGSVGDSDEQGSQGRLLQPERAGERAPWSSGLEWICGPDGKFRPVKSGVRLLADGVPGRVGKLRAFGNAIVPPLAAEFIEAFLECGR